MSCWICLSAPYLLALSPLLANMQQVAYGGNYLLDIGPASDGTIPTGMQDRLIGMGAWLAINGTHFVYICMKPFRHMIPSSSSSPPFD